MKCTRYEYMMIVDSFLNKKEYPNKDFLEVSGDTKEWHKFFQNITTTEFPKIDAHNLPFENNSFDCVALNQVLEHVKKPWVVVDEAYRVLRDGGIAILCSPFFYQVHAWPEDYWRFTPDGLEILCEKFSEILLKEKAGNKQMIKHMVDNPNDRSSNAFQKIKYLPLEKKDRYFVKSILIAKK